MLLPSFWRLPGLCPVSSHFTYFLYAIGAPLAVAPVVIPRVGRFVDVLSPGGSFKQTLLRNWQVLLLFQSPLDFTAITWGALPSWHWNSGLCGLAWGWDSSLQKYPSQFLSTTCECGTTSYAATTATTTVATSCHTESSLPFLPIWMNLASLNPWLLYVHTV